MSTTVRRYWLKLLRGAGVRRFKAKSELGFPFICHVGDFAGEAPFYSRQHCIAEISLMAAWCRELESPVIFDVGANSGFVATQLAQLLRERSPKIYSFEPVPSTFCQLVDSIGKLGLTQVVTPICCAVSDEQSMCTIAYNPCESLFAQVRNDTKNARAGDRLTVAPTMTLDNAVTALGKSPSLLKIDVEGFEPQVLKGAANLLHGGDPPAICFEWNPTTLSETNSSPAAISQSLLNFHLYYVDDFEGQRSPFAQPIEDLKSIDWVCNVFAIPAMPSALEKWTVAIRELQRN